MYDFAISAAQDQLMMKTTTAAYIMVNSGGLTVTKITSANYPATTVRGVVNLDGRFFVMTPTCEIYQSALEDGFTWAALEFIGSQLTPERGVFLHRHQNYILAMKEWSCEFFYDAANPTGSILAPVANAAFMVGVASDGSVAEVAGNLYWMGQTKSGFGRAIFRLNGTAPEKVSTPQVEKILNADNLATVHSWFANTGSHVLYGITLVTSGVTLVFDVSTGQWSFFTELAVSGSSKQVNSISAAGVVVSTSHGYSDGDIALISLTNSSWNGWQIVTAPTTNGYTIQLPSGVTAGTVFTGNGTTVPWGAAQKHTEAYFPVVASTSVNGVQYMQHATSGALYSFSQAVFVDPIGAIAARIRTPKFDAENAKFKYMNKVEVIGDKIASTATVRYTDDDFVTYSGARPVDLNVERSQLRRMGNFTRRSFELLHVKNALLRLEALEIEGSA